MSDEPKSLLRSRPHFSKKTLNTIKYTEGQTNLDAYSVKSWKTPFVEALEAILFENCFDTVNTALVCPVLHVSLDDVHWRVPQHTGPSSCGSEESHHVVRDLLVGSALGIAGPQ